jgi:hypothetical protein
MLSGDALPGNGSGALGLSLPSSNIPTVAAHSNDYGIPHHPERFQDVTNSSWPAPEVASRRSDHAAIPVTVRIVWDRDGETQLDGTATRWVGQHVFVRFTDERSRLGFAWVDAGDVRRR